MKKFKFNLIILCIFIGLTSGNSFAGATDSNNNSNQKEIRANSESQRTASDNNSSLSDIESDENGDYGWLGLFGLLGLAGFIKRDSASTLNTSKG